MASRALPSVPDACVQRDWCQLKAGLPQGFGDYSAEMRGLAKGLDLSLGDVVAGNLVCGAASCHAIRPRTTPP